MAPGRKKGANKAKAKGPLSLGDLVLAKVKGFPAWPAKISQPEDWDRAPDPKKYFVQFFGTQEIAFIAPPDIQVFTNEVKSKLLERCQGKTFRYFTQAVKEICADFEEVQKQKACGLTDRASGALSGHEAPTVDGNAADEVVKAELDNRIRKSGSGNDRPGDLGSKAESSVKSLDGSDSEDIKPKAPNGKLGKHESPDLVSGDSSSLKVENHDEIDNDNCSGQKTLEKSQKVKKMATGRNKRCEDGGDASSHLVGKSVNNEPSLGFGELPGPNRTLEDDKRGIDSTSKRVLSEDVSEPVLGTSSAKKTKDNSEKRSKVSDDKHDSTAKIKSEVSDKKKRAEPEQGKLMGTRKIQHPAKKPRCENLEDLNKLKTKPPRSNLDEKPEQSGSRQSVPDVRREIILGLGARAVAYGNRGRQSLAVPSTSSSLASHDKFSKRGREPRNTSSPSNNLRVSGNKVSKRRRAVCIYDDDEDEDPKTPIHGGHGGSLQSHAAVNSSSKGTCGSNDFSSKAKERAQDSTALEMNDSRELPPRKLSEAVSPALSGPEKKPVTRVTPHEKQVFESPSKDIKQISESHKKSPQLVSARKPVPGQRKPVKSSSKVSVTSFTKMSQASIKRAGAGFDDVNSSQSLMESQRSKPASSVERLKATPKTVPRMNKTGVLKENSLEVSGDTLKISREDRTFSLISTRTPDNSTSMKDLIAAAQAKRKQAHSESSIFSGFNPGFFNITEVEVKNHSPSTIQPAISGFSNAVATDLQVLQQQSSPGNNVHQQLSQTQLDAEQNEERRASSGHTTVGGSLSGGTEAAVARDAFEGMIETLSRTKESIARATRLAIDCAKYGIANEVVELLIRKLENESSFHRKVDLFFLLDSITQCSHNQKGIAGASYVPTVQAALPRLLGAAAPTGTGARENRRQCLKVLKLWLERKIFPEALLRRYIDDIGVSNDDATVGFKLRRPSRSERAVDDPIREMEGMLVDEYGSNASFQLPGLFSSRPFEDEDEDDDQPVFSVKEADDTSAAEPVHASGESEACMVTPNDRRNCILEVVDGELEMEDASAQPKEATGTQGKSTGVLDSAKNNPPELPSIPEGSPPLPPESPPSPPPLPPSPSPPPPPPPLLPPQPPPPSSPSPPPPPPPLPPQPPPTETQPPAPPPPALAPPPPLMSQPPIPSHPPLPSQPGYPPQGYALPQSTYQPPIPHEHRGVGSGNQIVQMAGSTSLGCHADGKAEFFHPQSSRFASIGVNNSREPSGHYFNPEPSQPNQQFQSSTVSFPQRPAVRPPVPSGHFPYPNPAIQPRPQHSYPHPYPLPSQPDGGRRYVREEPWRMPSNEHSMDNSSGAWIGGRHPRSGPPIVQDGYFRPPPERPPPSNMGFQIAPSNLPAGHPIPGHGVTQILPSRPDMPPVNCWRQA